MNQTIWKYPLTEACSQEVEMPEGAKILTILMQDWYPTIWVQVDPRKNKVPRLIQMTGTGFDDSDKLLGEYIGTVFFRDHTVWHYFDGGELLISNR